MAGFGNNASSHGPPNPPYFIDQSEQVACRFCDRVLSNFQALISHVKFHIARGDDIGPVNPNNQQYYPINQQNIQPNNSHIFLPNPNLGSRFTPPPPPPSSPTIPLAVPSGKSNLTLGGGPSSGAHSVKCNLGPTKRGGSSGNRAAKRSRRSVSVAAGAGEGEGASYRTRPFLSQLDHPIPRVVNLEMVNEDGLDLTLRLGNPNY